jgi:hypothetical protein
VLDGGELAVALRARRERGGNGELREGAAARHGVKARRAAAEPAEAPPGQRRRRMAATRRPWPEHGRGPTSALGRGQARGGGGPGRLRPWAEKGGVQPTKAKEFLFLFSFSEKQQ